MCGAAGCWPSRLLGLEALSGVVRQAFGRGLIDPMVMDYDDFRRDLERTLADPERMAGFSMTGSGRLRMRLASSRAGTPSRMRPSEDQERLGHQP